MINAGIISGLKPVQLESPMNSLAKLLEIQNAQRQNEMGSMQLDEARRANTERTTLSDLYKTSVSPDGQVDRNALFQGAAQRGLGAQIPGLQKTFNEQDKSAREAKKAELEGYLKKFELAGQIMNGVVDQSSYDRAREQTAQVFGPEAVAKMPPEFNPQLIAENQARAMSVKDKVEQQYKQLTFAETQRHNKATEGLTASGQQIQKDGQAQQRENSIRTDDRARDFNDTKVEDNRIKREAKDDTANLTKSSQLASFDTMLGTLDRLGKHPGLARSVGAMGMFPTIPGSDSANFQAELNTFQSQAFIPMVAQLKGMGALSDAEGKKLTAAVGALDPKMGEEAFRESIARIMEEMQAARQRVTGNGQKGVSGSFDAPKDGAVSKSKSGKPIVMRNGKWEYQ